MTLTHRPDLEMRPIDPLSDFDDFVSRLGDRDRQNVERHVAFCESEPTRDHLRLWKRLACTLARIAPRAAQTTSQRALRFYVADGKYQRQLFALEDLRDGTLAVYAGDSLAAVIAEGVLRGPLPGDGAKQVYAVCAEAGATLEIDSLTSANSPSAPEYYKHMLGWNRKAVKVTVPVNAGTAMVRAVERLCVLSARGADGQSPTSGEDGTPMLSRDEQSNGKTFILKLRDGSGRHCFWVETLRGETAKRWYDIYHTSDWPTLRRTANDVFHNRVSEREAEKARRAGPCVVIDTYRVTVDQLAPAQTS